MFRFVPFLLCLALTVDAFALQRNPVFSGKVVRIVSGDTMRVRLTAKGYPEDGKEVGLRIFGVDAPKLGEPFFEESKRRVSHIALNRIVVVEDWGKDEAGNYTGEVYVDLPKRFDERSFFTEIHGRGSGIQQIVLNHEIVASGLARLWKPRAGGSYAAFDERLQQALAAAQAAKRGIWSKS